MGGENFCLLLIVFDDAYFSSEASKVPEFDERHLRTFASTQSVLLSIFNVLVCSKHDEMRFNLPQHAFTRLQHCSPQKPHSEYLTTMKLINDTSSLSQQSPHDIATFHQSDSSNEWEFFNLIHEWKRKPQKWSINSIKSRRELLENLFCCPFTHCCFNYEASMKSLTSFKLFWFFMPGITIEL